MLIGGEIKKFEFPSAEQLRERNVNGINYLRNQCKRYIEAHLEGMANSRDLSQMNSILIPSDAIMDDELLLECTKEVLKGKGYDISLVNQGRSRGVMVRW